MTRAERVAALLAVAVATTATATATVQAEQPSFGTLLRCETERCLWAARDGSAVPSAVMVRQFLQDEELEVGAGSRDFRRRMESHVAYLEEVQLHAEHVGMTFPYAMGVNARHLYHDSARRLSPQEFVEQELESFTRRRERQRQRRLDTAGNSSTSSETYRESLNWCSTDNARNESICTGVKSQNQCGSCWAFAAADSIEAAVVVNAGTEPQSLSPQQFLECSTREMTATFSYCWADGGVVGSTWLESKMTWGSENSGCDGGMTHGAFADAAQLHWSLLSQLDLPYDEEESSQASSATLATACSNSSTENAAASITGWEQVVGESCSNSSDASVLLRLALQQQPVSVAINSGGSFNEYKGGVYTCPNDGNFSTSSDIDHALVLVGYGYDADDGDYWILKNSYGSAWGDKGFLKLAADDKINCGLSVFPVIPTGAASGATHTTVDGGGDVVFVGLSPDAWIAVAISVSVATIVLTVVGVIYANRRRNTFMDML